LLELAVQGIEGGLEVDGGMPGTLHLDLLDLVLQDEHLCARMVVSTLQHGHEVAVMIVALVELAS
jgi:hypothetical protein